MRNPRERIWLDILHAYLFETPFERITYLRQLQRIDNQNPLINFQLGFAYYSLSQNVNAIREYENALKIYKDWGSKPYWVRNYTNLGQCYHLAGQFSKERQLYKKAEKDFPNDLSLTYRYAVLSLSEGDTVVANQYIEKLKSIATEQASNDAVKASRMASLYSEAGILDKAEEYYRQALSLEPVNPLRINNLGYFLIDKDRNVPEGMELVNKVLEISPDNFNYLHTKGWGLYKQGKYQEAFDILQKSSDIRREKSIYNYEAYLHLAEAKKAVASQKETSTSFRSKESFHSGFEVLVSF